MIINKIDEVLAKQKSTIARTRNETPKKRMFDAENVITQKSGSSRYLFKIIDNTRKKRVAPSSDCPSPSHRERQQKELIEQTEHKILCDRIFNEHETSRKNASQSSARASSATKRIQNVVKDATCILNTYKEVQESLQQHCQERLHMVIAEQEETDRKNALPNYMSWRPKHYHAAQPKRATALYYNPALKYQQQQQ